MNCAELVVDELLSWYNYANWYSFDAKQVGFNW